MEKENYLKDYFMNDKKILMVVDIDLTIADNQHRVHLLPNWKAFFAECDKDKPIIGMIQAISFYQNNPLIDMIFISSRSGDEDTLSKTKAWLESVGFDKPLFLRPSFEKTADFKANALESYKNNSHAYVIIIDDEIKVIEKLKHKYQTVLVYSENNYKNTIDEFSLKMNHAIKKLQNNALKP